MSEDTLQPTSNAQKTQKNTESWTHQTPKNQIHSDSFYVDLPIHVRFLLWSTAGKYIQSSHESVMKLAAPSRLFSGFAVFDGRSTQRRFATAVWPNQSLFFFHFKSVTPQKTNTKQWKIHEWMSRCISWFPMEKIEDFPMSCFFCFRRCCRAFFVAKSWPLRWFQPFGPYPARPFCGERWVLGSMVHQGRFK